MRVAGYHLATLNARSSDTRVEIRQRQLVIFHIDTLPFRPSAGLTIGLFAERLITPLLIKHIARREARHTLLRYLS